MGCNVEMSILLEDNHRVVKVQVGFLSPKIKQVRIDAKSGKITQCV